MSQYTDRLNAFSTLLNQCHV